MIFQLGNEGQVACDGQPLLTFEQTLAFLNGAMKRRMRQRGVAAHFVRALRQYGHAEASWNFVRRIRTRDDHWVTMHAHVTEEGVSLTCIGPQAEAAVDKSNRREEQKVSRGYHRACKRMRLRDRRARRQKKYLQRVARQAALQVPKQEKRRRTFVPAPLSLARSEVLTPQFRKNRILWSEALTAVAEIFQVRGNGRHAARQLVARELWHSLEQSGFRFAQYKRCGFSMRFDLCDGLWRGDITPLTVSCTKDNGHETYRRMRAYLGTMLSGLPPQQQRRRRMLLGVLREAA